MPASTPQGQPYFVMEYVPGLPITEYCDQHKLKIRERLELFIQACEGVQHAHQKAIIHRDLKPANILVVEVDGKPVPRIIDFGLAKATTPHAYGPDAAYALRAVHGNTRLHESGAGRSEYAGHRHAHRRVFAWRDSLRAADRAAAVRDASDGSGHRSMSGCASCARKSRPARAARSVRIGTHRPRPQRRAVPSRSSW